MKMDPKKKNEIREKKKEYMEKVKSLPTLDKDFTTVSSDEVEILYTPDDVEDLDYMDELGFPGEYPYTRGIHANM